MEMEKKHILKTFKNEQEAIDEVQRINAERENPPTSSITGDHVEDPLSIDDTTNGFIPDSVQVMEDISDDSVETEDPDELANKSIDLERPLPERIINNRVR